MAFGKTGILGVEMGLDRLRVVRGAVSGPSLRVYDFATEEILVANSENVAQQLETRISSAGHAHGFCWREYGYDRYQLGKGHGVLRSRNPC